ncbi:MAG: putative exported carboxypeptidase [Anaerocolumna sp.]|jgi:hypothetical protein|nr:putative exported carboxypeptidase [Anaerocolumna sp.]
MGRYTLGKNKKFKRFIVQMIMVSLLVQNTVFCNKAKAMNVNQTDINIEDAGEVISNTPSVTPDSTSYPTNEPTLTVTPSIGPTDIPTVTETPTITLTPTPTPTITPTITPSVTPTPTNKPTATPTPTKTPDKFIPNTLKLMAKYDYVGNSVTNISIKKLSLRTLQNQIKNFGKLYGYGMPIKEYTEAMSNKWIDVTEYNKKPVKITIDISKTMDYKTYVDTLKKLSRYDGVYLYKIGKSTQGRDLYAVEIDVNSSVKKDIFMLTGQIHAREFAGGTFVVKEFVDLIQKAQTDKKTMDLLKKNKFVAVPIINVDGREALIKEPKKWTKGSELWKAYTNGTDGNRNFPGLQWGQVMKGYSRKSYIADKPGYSFYAGDYAGSNKETKAMMKWLYHYIVVEQATYFLDLHQQGSIIYAGKGWQTKQQESRSLNLRTKVMSILNSGYTYRKYSRVFEGTSYGLQGEGSSLTDYAISLAIGAKFSPASGFMVFTDKGKEYMLLEVKDLDTAKIKVKEANKKFAAITLEIGYGTSYLGNSTYTRNLLANEYRNYKFGELLKSLPIYSK